MKSSSIISRPVNAWLTAAAAVSITASFPVARETVTFSPLAFVQRGGGAGGLRRTCPLLQLFRPTVSPLLGGAGGSRARRSQSSTPSVSTTNPSGAPHGGSPSLAEFFPELAATWVTATSNKMLLPQNVYPDSRKLVWWRCPFDGHGCGKQFKKRIDLHVAAGGECPHCHRRVPHDANPAATHHHHHAAAAGKRKGKGTDGDEEAQRQQLEATREMKRLIRSRPDANSDTVINAGSRNRIKQSVAEASILLRRGLNVLPMLAKNYEKESAKIAADEVVYLSPKLDGIRCLAAYDPETRSVLFFSRAGTLFECCDFSVLPAISTLFEKDPELVLDGELYYDGRNQATLLRAYQEQQQQQQKGSKSGKGGDGAAQRRETAFLLEQLTANVNLLGAGDAAPGDKPHRALVADTMKKALAGLSRGGRSNSKNNGNSSSSGAADDDIPFERIVSAVRTMREKRTPEVAALQAKLQYHIFDVLYAGDFKQSSSGVNTSPSKASKGKRARSSGSNGTSGYVSLPFRDRYRYLQSILADARAANIERYNTLLEFSQGKTGGGGPDAAPLPFYDALRLVPSVACTKQQCDRVLRLLLSLGYEGLMVRRDAQRAQDGVLTLPPPAAAAAADFCVYERAALAVHEHQNALFQLPSAADGAATAKRRGKAASAAAAAGGFRAALAAHAAADVNETGGYGYGQRSSTLLKYKVMQDDEFLIVGVVEGKGKWKGQIGAFECVVGDPKVLSRQIEKLQGAGARGGANNKIDLKTVLAALASSPSRAGAPLRTFTVTPASTDEEKRRMWRQQSAYLGRALTVQFQSRAADGVPRFPVGKGIRGHADGSDWI